MTTCIICKELLETENIGMRKKSRQCKTAARWLPGGGGDTLLHQQVPSCLNQRNVTATFLSASFKANKHLQRRHRHRQRQPAPHHYKQLSHRSKVRLHIPSSYRTRRTCPPFRSVVRVIFVSVSVSVPNRVPSDAGV